ncbi:MAG: N-acetylneuraminate synthase family protein [Bryobacteraceae bacterium]|nr:N-acetylneuraminate synthase family protein [Bryobacteraceae bacterium]
MSSEARTIIVGEVAQAHDGSLGFAHAYIDAIANAGADAVKFQTHIAAAESSPQEPWRVKFSYQDATRYDYWKRMEFTPEQWAGLKKHATERGLQFLSTPFSMEACELLNRIGVAAWKIASGEFNNHQLFNFVLGTGLPVWLSTGMSSMEEIDRAASRVMEKGAPLTVFQCTSAYPCPPEKVGLNMIPLLRRRYGAGVGLSDHSGTIYPGLAAATVGIEVLEIHVTMSREMFGPDVAASVTSAEFRQLVDGIRFIERMKANPVDKDQVASEMDGMRKLFVKSIAARMDLPAGAVLSESHLTMKKPGTGITADRLPELIGRRLARPVAAGEFLAEADMEPQLEPVSVAHGH